MCPFIALQAAVSTLRGFAGVFVFAARGAAAVAPYAALTLACAALSIVLSCAPGVRRASAADAC